MLEPVFQHLLFVAPLTADVHDEHHSAQSFAFTQVRFDHVSPAFDFLAIAGRKSVAGHIHKVEFVVEIEKIQEPRFPRSAADLGDFGSGESVEKGRLPGGVPTNDGHFLYGNRNILRDDSTLRKVTFMLGIIIRPEPEGKVRNSGAFADGRPAFIRPWLRHKDCIESQAIRGL